MPSGLRFSSFHALLSLLGYSPCRISLGESVLLFLFVGLASLLLLVVYRCTPCPSSRLSDLFSPLLCCFCLHGSSSSSLHPWAGCFQFPSSVGAYPRTIRGSSIGGSLLPRQAFGVFGVSCPFAKGSPVDGCRLCALLGPWCWHGGRMLGPLAAAGWASR